MEPASSNTEDIMKKQAIMVLSLMLVLGTFGLQAQAQNTERMVINIPFLFTAGETTLPAGKYAVKRISQSSLVIQNLTMPRAVAIVSAVGSVEGGGRAAAAKLVFRAYEGEHFLSQVWMPGHSAGREVPVSRTENVHVREIADSRMQPQTVAVIAAQ